MQNKLLLLRCRKYLLRKHRKKFHWHFFSEKNFPHELLGIVGSFLICCLGSCFGIFVKKKYFLFSEQALLGYTPFEKTSSMNRQTVRLTFPKIYIFRNRNKNKQNSSLNTIYSGKKYLVNHFQY